MAELTPHQKLQELRAQLGTEMTIAAVRAKQQEHECTLTTAIGHAFAEYEKAKTEPR